MSRKRACQAKDPTTCRNHGAAAILAKKERALLTKITEALSPTSEPDCFSDAERRIKMEERRAGQLHRLGQHLDPSHYDEDFASMSGSNSLSQELFAERSALHKEAVAELVRLKQVHPDTLHYIRKLTTHHSLNRNLIQGKSLTPEEFTEMKSIDAVIAHLPASTPMRLYRGVSFSSVDHFQSWKQANMDAAGVLAPPAYIRTSPDPYRALSFADSRKEESHDVIFEYVTGKGLYTGDLVQTSDEREVVIGRNEPFMIHREAPIQFNDYNNPGVARRLHLVQLS